MKRDPGSGTYRKVVFKEDKIAGCILLGNVKGNLEILNAIEKKTDIRDLKDSILEEEFDFNRLK